MAAATMNVVATRARRCGQGRRGAVPGLREAVIGMVRAMRIAKAMARAAIAKVGPSERREAEAAASDTKARITRLPRWVRARGEEAAKAVAAIRAVRSQGPFKGPTAGMME